MSAPLALFDYQRGVVAAMVDAFAKPSTRPLAVVPTGGGIAGLAEAFLGKYPSARIIVTTRSRGISQHNLAALNRLDPSISTALFAGRPVDASVTYAAAQKLFRYPEIVASADLVIIDEADQAFLEASRQYGAILKAARQYCGLTGTPFRLVDRETKPIFGPDAPYDLPCASISKNELIALGRILPIEAVAGSTGLDITRARLGKDGSFDTTAQSTSAAMLEAIVADVAEALEAEPAAFLFYASTVEQAEAQATAFTKAGLRCAAIDGAMPRGQREALDKAFRDGELMTFRKSGWS